MKLREKERESVCVGGLMDGWVCVVVCVCVCNVERYVVGN